MNKPHYEYAKESYARLGVDIEKAMAQLDQIPISIHCWQGDDVAGFEADGMELSGGIQVTGCYPGRARNPQQLRADLDKALSLLPGPHKVSLHAIYAEGAKDRNDIAPAHFENWVAWAKERDLGLDFNSTFFAHPNSDAGFTLSSHEEDIRAFWIEHGKKCRQISEYLGKELGKKCIHNIWIPDGFKDIPIDRNSYRLRLKDSLDQMCSTPSQYSRDSVECKLFGIGSESCVIGSHEFYMGYAAKNNMMLTLDSGHFHPTEVISDKISSSLAFMDEILLHVSRPVRWDSDHVVIFDDELKAIALEIVRNGFQNRVHIGLDYFDASINRIAAWVVGVRNTKKALLYALLEPTELLRKAELQGDYTKRLALTEELKSFPFAIVWDAYCERHNVPVGTDWMDVVTAYEKDVLSTR